MVCTDLVTSSLADIGIDLGGCMSRVSAAETAMKETGKFDVLDGNSPLQR